MKKTEFLQALQAGLAAASPEERVAALQYYTEYLDEAGPEREEEVLRELGDPAAIARDILAASPTADGEGWTPPPKAAAEAPETPAVPEAPAAAPPAAAAEDTAPQNDAAALGMPPPPVAPPPPGYTPPAQALPMYPPVADGAAPPPQSAAPPPRPVYDQRNTNLAKIILIVLVAILIVPSIGVFAGVLVSIICVFFVPIIVGVSLIAASVATIVAGAFVVAAAPGSGLVAIGLGVLILGLGLLACYGGGVLVGRTLPALIRLCFRAIGGLWRKLFPKTMAP